MRAKKKIGRGCGNCLLKKIIAFILSLEGFPILFLHYASLYTNSNILLLGSYFKIACIYSLELFGTSCWMHTHILPNKKNQDSSTALINFTQLPWVNDSMRRVNQLCILLWMSIHHLQFNYFSIWNRK